MAVNPVLEPVAPGEVLKSAEPPTIFVVSSGSAESAQKYASSFADSYASLKGNQRPNAIGFSQEDMVGLEGALETFVYDHPAGHAVVISADQEPPAASDLKDTITHFGLGNDLMVVDSDQARRNIKVRDGVVTQDHAYDFNDVLPKPSAEAATPVKLAQFAADIKQHAYTGPDLLREPADVDQAMIRLRHVPGTTPIVLAVNLEQPSLEKTANRMYEAVTATGTSMPVLAVNMNDRLVQTLSQLSQVESDQPIRVINTGWKSKEVYAAMKEMMGEALAAESFFVLSSNAAELEAAKQAMGEHAANHVFNIKDPQSFTDTVKAITVPPAAA